jgi:RHS repeat-associated protein
LTGCRATARSFDDAGNLLSESYSGGLLSSLLVTNSCDSLLRRTNPAIVQNSTTPLLHQSFSYDAASRLKTVTVGEHVITYTYLDDSPLVSQIAFQRGSATPMTTTRQYDKLNRLTNIVSAPSGSPAVSFSYGYNAANQRTERKESDGSRWSFGYDSLGQVTSGKKYWADSSPVAGQQFGYAFDTIGNRLSTSRGGDNSGQNLRTANYTNSALNQIVGRDVPGFVDVLGSANANANVLSWVDTSSFAQPERKGSYFRAELPVNNSTGAVWMVISNFALMRGSPDRLTNSVMHAFVPMTPETFGYDADGNMTNDGRFSYTWDGENRLTKIESKSSAPTASKCRLQMTYDWQSRRTEKVVHTNNGAGYVGQHTNRFVYDGWNLIAELGPDGTLLRSHVWGLDASGTMQGAGGVGGLLATVIHTGVHAGTYFPSYDGNYNVMAMIRASDGELVARYNHGPFGELLQASGPMAREFNFLFSTKYYDWETGLYYYGYRYYGPSAGRWLSRDPAAENGLHILVLDGQAQDKPHGSIYGIVGNDLLDNVDLLGLINLIDSWPPGPQRPEWPPRNPFAGADLRKYDCSCCGEGEVEDGMEVLTTRFVMAAQWLDDHGVKKTVHGKPGSGNASCFVGNKAILSVMWPVPRCWICFMDHRYNTMLGSLGPDENFIHCFSMGNVHRDVVFDWWKGRIDDKGKFQGGVYEGIDLGDYYRHHPYESPIWEHGNPMPRDCSDQSSRPWEFDSSPLDELLKKTQSDYEAL